MPRLALGLVCLSFATAAAQPAGNVTLDAFRPAMDARGYLTVNASQTLDGGELAFGLGSLDWGHALLSLDGGGSSYSIDDIITATLAGAYGLRVGAARLELGASLPLRIMSGSRGQAGDQRFAVDGQGLGDLGLHLKAELWRRGGFGLGAIAGVYLPTSSPADRFLGEAGAVPQLIVAADQELGRVRVAVNAGLRLRATTTFTNDDPGPRMAPVTGRSITAGSELPFGAAIAYAVARQRFELIGEVFGAVPLGDHRGYQPLEALAGVKLYLARNSYLTLGAGRGLLDEGGSPAMRAVIAIMFEPGRGAAATTQVADPPARPPPLQPPGDRDGDRITDDLDKCPDEPEDVDGYQDDDGCPDPDNDGDRILDQDDLCPDQPETYNNFEDDDGCPDDGVTRKVDGGILILQPIQFEYNSAVIKPDSFYILDAVVATMNGYPDLTQIEVQGHTDERGDDAYNLELSERRAAAVVTYLVEHGVAAVRLRSHGYGETAPLDRRHTEAAWKKNRRVDFVLQGKD
jgi:outer membrane protein OmpA-like peptidoglycan-associated protein